MGPYRHLLLPLLQRLDPESSHALTIAVMSRLQHVPGTRAFARQAWAYSDPALAFTWKGLRFRNRVGLAAGLDKNARLVPFFAAAGAGFIEIGTVTPLPQPGNSKPRLARLKAQQALVNRLGFPSDGLPVVRARLARLRQVGIPIGANIGKNAATPLERAAEDYLTCLEGLYPVADYFTVNVSSPNTAALRDLQAKPALEALTKAIVERRKALAGNSEPKPLLLKLSADLDERGLNDAADVCLVTGIDGIIAVNTTTNETIRAQVGAPIAGGVSGPPLRRRALEVIAHLRGRLPADYFLVGVGGISSAADARAMLAAGANAVQLYTGLIYQGAGLVGAIARGQRS